MSSFDSRNSGEPKGLLRTLLAAFSGVFVGWVFSKVLQEDSKTTREQDSTANPENRTVTLTPRAVQRIDTEPKQHHTERSTDNAPLRKKIYEWSVSFGTIGLLIVNMFLLSITKKEASAAKDAARAAQDQVTLVKQQLVGTIGAIVVFNPNISGEFFGYRANLILENRGHVISPSPHLRFQWSVHKMSNLNLAFAEGVYEKTFPQIAASGNEGDLLDFGARISPEFSKQINTLKLEGEYDFDNGFGNRTTENFCLMYLGHSGTQSEGEGVSNNNAGFFSCSEFQTRLRYIYAHPKKK